MRSPDRLAVLWCPQWPIVAAGAGVDEPVAVLHANRVVARSRTAAAAGVRLGQRRREAQARCPEVRLVAHEPQVDHRAFQPVAEVVARFVPRLEFGRAGMITFLTRGPSRYFGGDDAMAARVLAAVDEVLGERTVAAGSPSIGIADGRFAAQVAARSAGRSAGPAERPTERPVHGALGAETRVQVVAPGGSPAFLAPLPLRWLLDGNAARGAAGTGPGTGPGIGPGGPGVVATQLVELFARLGVRTLGELAALPAADVLARFGQSGMVAWCMAAGVDDRPVGAEDPPEGLALVHHFETPMQHLDAVVFAGRHLAEQLAAVLAEAGRVCTQFVAVAETDHGETSERLWSLSTGFTAAAMVERLRWQLDGWARLDPSSTGQHDLRDPDPETDPLADSGVPTSGIVQLRLEPTEVRADDGVQLGLWGGRSQADDWARRAATRLAGLLGDDQVVVAEWRGGRHPADIHRWVPASLSTRLDPGARATSGASGHTTSGHTTSGRSGLRRPPWPGGLPMPSPSTVFADPVAVTVVDDRGRPVAVSGRGEVSAAPAVLRTADGVRTRIEAWAGPWLVEERWWDAARHRRLARFQLLTDDGHAHLAALERSQWWLMATYD